MDFTECVEYLELHEPYNEFSVFDDTIPDMGKVSGNIDVDGVIHHHTNTSNTYEKKRVIDTEELACTNKKILKKTDPIVSNIDPITNQTDRSVRMFDTYKKSGKILSIRNKNSLISGNSKNRLHELCLASREIGNSEVKATDELVSVDTTQFGPLFHIIQAAGGIIAGGSVFKAVECYANPGDIDVFVTVDEFWSIKMNAGTSSSFFEIPIGSDFNGGSCTGSLPNTRAVGIIDRTWYYDFLILNRKVSPHDLIETFDLSIIQCFVRNDNMVYVRYPSDIKNKRMKVANGGGACIQSRIEKFEAYGYKTVC